MISRKILHNVLKMAATGEEKEKPGAPGVAPAQAVETSYVVYAYSAPEDKAIDFKNIERDLKNPEESKALVEKLQSLSGQGVTKYSAGYFSWKKVLVVTNRYDQAKKRFVVYHANVTSTGTIEPGPDSDKVEPSSTSPTPDQVKEEFSLFKNGILNIQTGSPGEYEVYYHNGEPQGDIIKHLLANPKAATQGEPYNVFSQKLDQFRIWTTNGLIRPDFKRSTTDGVKGGYYPGGENAFKSMILPLVKEVAPEKPGVPGPSLGEKIEKEPIYSPAQEKTTPVKGQFLDDTLQNQKMAANCSSELNLGGDNVVQLSAQECARTRKRAQSVVMSYLKESAYQGTPSAITGPATDNKGMTLPMTTNTKKNEDNVKKINKEIEKLNQKVKTVSQTQTVSGTPGSY